MELHLALKWMSCPWLQELVRDKSYTAVTGTCLSTPNAASPLGKRDRETRWVSALTFPSRLRCCHVSLIVKKERIQAQLLPPGLSPSSAVSVHGEGREQFVILRPGQLLAEVAELSDRGASDNISAYRHRACIEQLPLNSHHEKPVHHQLGQ